MADKNKKTDEQKLNIQHRMTKDAWFESYNVLRGWVSVVKDRDFNNIIRYSFILHELGFFISIHPPTKDSPFYSAVICSKDPNKELSGFKIINVAEDDKVDDMPRVLMEYINKQIALLNPLIESKGK